MGKVLSIQKSPQPNELNHPFLQELVKQIHLLDTFGKYRDCSDELLVNQLIISLEKEENPTKSFYLDPLNQLVTNAFYKAIGVIVERRTKYTTETYINLRNKELSSAVICCSGVLVLYSLIWRYRSFGFLSLQELIESAEANINDASTKAKQYLDFVD